MGSEYFFTANSNGFMLGLNFFDRQEEGKVYLNLTFNFGNSRQNLECESVGYWLTLSDVANFRNKISKGNFITSLIDVDGNSVFEISGRCSEVVLSHSVLGVDGSGATDRFDLKFVVANSFIDELIGGLHGWLFENLK